MLIFRHFSLLSSHTLRSYGLLWCFGSGCSYNIIFFPSFILVFLHMNAINLYIYIYTLSLSLLLLLLLLLALLLNEIDKSKSTSFKTTKLLYLSKLLLISLALFVLVVVGFQSLLRTEYCCFSLFIFHRAVDSFVWGVPISRIMNGSFTCFNFTLL